MAWYHHGERECVVCRDLDCSERMLSPEDDVRIFHKLYPHTAAVHYCLLCGVFYNFFCI